MSWCALQCRGSCGVRAEWAIVQHSFAPRAQVKQSSDGGRFPDLRQQAMDVCADIEAMVRPGVAFARGGVAVRGPVHFTPCRR